MIIVPVVKHEEIEGKPTPAAASLDFLGLNACHCECKGGQVLLDDRRERPGIRGVAKVEHGLAARLLEQELPQVFADRRVVLPLGCRLLSFEFDQHFGPRFPEDHQVVACPHFPFPDLIEEPISPIGRDLNTVAALACVQGTAEGVEHFRFADERFAAIVYREDQVADSTGFTDCEAAGLLA